jgi:Flp pilus assembly pilin Flp
MRQLAAILIAKAHGLRADDGQDLMEYALLAALISIFCAGAVTTLGTQVNTVLWQTIANNF